MGLALQVLSKFSRLAASHQVDHIIAGATSAVREAENGGEFLHAIVSQTGIRARVIAGTEEARLIHLAAAYGLGLSGEVAVVIDIGGGSVEITRGTGPAIDLGRSFKVGVIRLTERFVKSDPISSRDERKLVRHIETELDAHLTVAGAVLLDTILRRLRADEISLCDLSLREGLILDYIAKHRKEIAQADRYPDVRRRSVIELAERCSYWPDHAHHIARLALALFDRTRSIHGMTDKEREWLEYAAILHDAGVH